MAVKAVQYAGLNSLRGLSGAIWSRAPIAQVQENPQQGMWFFDDFLNAGNAVMSSAYGNSIGAWSSYADAGALLQSGNDTSGTLANAEGGVINIIANDDNEGVALFSSAASYQIQTANSTTAPGYRGKMFYEARFSRSTIAATKVDCWMGLCTPILTAGVAVAANPISTTINVLSTTFSHIGFFSSGSSAGTPGGPTEIAFEFTKASGTVNYPTGLTSCMAATGNTVLAAGAFVKVGFVFDPTPTAPMALVTVPTARQTAGTLRRKILQPYINGIPTPTFLTTEDLANATSGQLMPIDLMAPTFAVMNDAGSSPGSMSVDWVACLQMGMS